MLRKFKNFKLKRKNSKNPAAKPDSDFNSDYSSNSSSSSTDSGTFVRIFLYENDDSWITVPIDVNSTVRNILDYVARRTCLDKIELWEQIFKISSTSGLLPVMERKLFDEERPLIMQAIMKPEFGFERKFKIIQGQISKINDSDYESDTDRTPS